MLESSLRQNLILYKMFVNNTRLAVKGPQAEGFPQVLEWSCPFQEFTPPSLCYCVPAEHRGHEGNGPQVSQGKGPRDCPG